MDRRCFRPRLDRPAIVAVSKTRDVASISRAPAGADRRAEIQIGQGGLREAAIRGLLYVGMARGMVDERSLEALRRVRMNEQRQRLTLAQFKMLVREQFFMLLLDQDASLAAIPKLLPENADERRAAFEISAKSCPPVPRFPAKRPAHEASRRTIRRRHPAIPGRDWSLSTRKAKAS